MSKPLHIEEALTIKLLSDTFNIREELAPIATHSHQCKSCGATMLYPRVARRADVEHVQMLINILEDFVKESGAGDWAIARIIADCHIAIASRYKEESND